MGKKQEEKLEALKSNFERSATEQYIQVNDGNQLRVLSFIREEQTVNEIEVMFIPGLLTIFPRWEKVVKELNKHYTVHYIESREKISSKLLKRASLDLRKIWKDLSNIEKTLGLDKKRYITISSSMGGSMIIENLATNELSPIGSILIGPGVKVHFPKWVPIFLHVFPAFGMRMLKPLIRWYLRTFTVDAKKEPKQAKQYTRSVNEADMPKLRKWIIKNANKYNGWHLLPKIEDRIILIAASTDKVHKSDFSAKVSEALSNCTYVDLGTNEAAHDTPLVELAIEFTNELQGIGPKVVERDLLSRDKY